MTSYSSKEMNIMGAKAFVDSVNESDGRSTKNSTILYAVLGKSTHWPNEPNAPTATETIKDKHYTIWKDAIGAKKINTNDVSHVVPRHDWTTGTVYPMYKHTNINLYSSDFYVLTDQNNVYKCLYNNKGGQSTVKPAGFSTTAFTTSDGYTWKYMYTISLGLASKFLTASHMPVQTLSESDGSAEQTNQLAVQNASVNGAIQIIETNDVGSGYGMLNSTAVIGATSTTVQLAQGNPSSVDNHYNGDSVYIQSGTGLGQLRRIVNYDGSTRTLTTNTGFSTTPDTTSTIIISPTVNIIGDGVGALAYSLVNTNGNISYNSGKRGSSSGVVVYGNGRTTTTSNSNSGNVSGVTYYNVGRSSTSQDDNIGVDNNDIRIRTYKDFVKNNSGVKNNVERNRIYSRPEMGVGNSNSRSSANSYDIDDKRRYYSNPSNLGNGRPASSSQSSWGLSGRNSNTSSSSGVRSYSNPGSSSSSSSSRSYNSSSSTYSRSSGPPTMGSSSRSSSSSSVGSSGRGSRQ